MNLCRVLQVNKRHICVVHSSDTNPDSSIPNPFSTATKKIGLLTQMNKTNLVLGVFLAALLVSLYVVHASIYSAPESRESFAQKEVGMAVDGVGMGPYDNVSVPGASGWMQTEKSPKDASPVSGMPNLDFMLNPRTSSSCCPSAYTTDNGCVCLSDQDKTMMSSRGGNKV